jgi:3-methyladenine DNA glycosylase AlkC
MKTSDMTLLANELLSVSNVATVPELRAVAVQLWQRYRHAPDSVTQAAIQAWLHAEEGDRRIRMVACLLLGPASATVPVAHRFLLDTCSRHPDWRLQEMLAKAFCWHCDQKGWRMSVSTLEHWLRHPLANVRRAAAEGPRIWTRRDYFKEQPLEAVQLLGIVRSDTSTYVLDAAAHAISDISRTHPDLVLAALTGWMEEHGCKTRFFNGASRHLQKSHPKQITNMISDT